jgi:hypothetical protein
MTHRRFLRIQKAKRAQRKISKLKRYERSTASIGTQHNRTIAISFLFYARPDLIDPQTASTVPCACMTNQNGVIAPREGSFSRASVTARRCLASQSTLAEGEISQARYDESIEMIKKSLGSGFQLQSRFFATPTVRLRHRRDVRGTHRSSVAP